MGNYTTLDATVSILPEKADAMFRFLDKPDPERERWSLLLPEDHPWLKVSRRDFIPFGALSYTSLPDCREYNSRTRLFNFRCSIKNYEDEIEQFVETVLPEISDGYHIRLLRERDIHFHTYEKNWIQLIEHGQKWKVLDSNRIFGGRTGTVVGIEISERGADEIKRPQQLDLLDLEDDDLVQLGLDIDTSGWSHSGTPYFSLWELERIHNEK